MFAVGFALRLAYAWIAQGPGAVPSSDPQMIDDVAWNLARGAGFAFNGATGPYPTAVCPPVVPWIVSGLYRVVGHDYFAALVLQCAIGALAAPLAGALAGALFGSGVARLSGWLTAVHPVLVFFSAYLLTETVFATVLLLALAASVSWVKRPRAGRALGLGLLWGVAILTRPTAFPMPWLIAAWAWVPIGLVLASGRERARQLLLLLLGVALAIAPWSARNTMLVGRFTLLKTGGGRTFLDANQPAVWDDPALRGGAGNAYTTEPYASLLRGRSEVEADSIGAAEAWKFLNARRAEWPAMALAKVGRFWRLGREAGNTGTWQRAGSPLARVLRVVDPLFLWSLAIFPLALWGTARLAASPRRWFQSVIPATILLFTALAIPYWGAIRLRAPIEPLIAMLAAFGIEDLARLLRVRARGFRVIEGTPAPPDAAAR